MMSYPLAVPLLAILFPFFTNRHRGVQRLEAQVLELGLNLSLSELNGTRMLLVIGMTFASLFLHYGYVQMVLDFM